MAMIKLLQKYPAILRMLGPDKVRMTVKTGSLDDRVRAVRTITNPLLSAVPETKENS